MLTKIKPKNINLQRQIIALFFSIFFSCMPTKAAQNEHVSLYLPVHSSQYNIHSMLENALQKSGLGHITIKYADHWQQYQQNIRHGRQGIYFAPPHFTAWLVEQHNFTPLLKVKDSLKYVITSRSSDSHIFEMSDLIDRKICTQNPLNLDFLLINSAFKKSIKTADAHYVASVADEMNAEQSPCSAFSISNHFYLEQNFQSQEQPQREAPVEYIRLAQSEQLNNYAVSIHPSLADKYSEKLISFFSSKEVQKSLSPLLKLTSSEAQLVNTNKLDYPSHYTDKLELYWGTNK